MMKQERDQNMKYFQNIEGGGVNPASPDRADISSHLYVRRFSRSIVLRTIFVLCLATPAFAQGDQTPAAPKDEVLEVGDADTHLIVDTEQNIVRIMIEGREVGQFYKGGLRVVGDIEYTGSMTDTTASWLPETPPAKGDGDVE